MIKTEDLEVVNFLIQFRLRFVFIAKKNDPVLGTRYRLARAIESARLV